MVKPNVFLCHSSEDHNFVIDLAERLKRDGIEVWIDDWKIKPGDSITEKVNEGLSNCDFFLIVLSKNSLQSNWVKRELNSTLIRQINKQDVKIIPIFLNIEPSEAPLLIQDIYGIKFKRVIAFSEYKKLLDSLTDNEKISELKSFQDRFLEDIQHIDIILKKAQPTQNEVKIILHLIKEKKYENYFFAHIKKLSWFFLLKEKGYFSPEKAPVPEQTSEGGYRIPIWNVLPYLERVSNQLTEIKNKNERSKYTRALLEIIKDVTKYHKHKKELDNYHIWDSFISILANLDPEEIPMDIIDFIPRWLNSKFDNTLQSQGIALKLLPRFLEGRDISKAEKILEYITDIKIIPMPKERAKLFERKYEATLLIDSYWLEKGLKQYINKIGRKCSIEFIFNLANNLKKFFRFNHSENKIDILYNSKPGLLCLKFKNNKNNKKSLKNEFDFVCEAGYCKPVKQKEKSILYTPKPKIKREDRIEFNITQCYTKEDFLKQIKEKLPNTVKILKEKSLEALYEGIYIDFSFITVKSLFEPEEYTMSEPEGILILMLRDIVLEKIKKDKESFNKIFEKFTSYEYQYPVFKRILLYVIGNKWKDFKEKFWELVDKESDLLFNSSYFEAEIYTILKKYIRTFTSEEKKKIKKIIEEGPKRYLPEKEQEKYIAYWKQKWYSALKKDKFFKSLYEKNRRITKIKEELTFKRPEVKVGPGESPLSKEKIMKLENEKLAKFLHTFRTKDPIKGPTVSALAEALRVVAYESPGKFIDNFEPFLNIYYIYEYYILWGIRDAIQQKKFINWENLLSFIKKYTSPETGFWDNKFQLKDFMAAGADYLWVVGMIGEIIQEGTKDKDWHIPKDLFDNAKKLLFDLLSEMVKRQVKSENITDISMYTLNSPYGRLITALLYLSLRIADTKKEEKPNKEVVWDDEIKEVYEFLLEKRILEAYVIIGQYMPQFYYLDKKWLEEKIENFIRLENLTLWEGFMEGYLFINRFYKELYQLMKEHYIKAIPHNFKNKIIEERLVQHISIAYLKGIEDLSETQSLFYKLLQNWKASHIIEISKFFWLQREVVLLEISGEKKLDIKEKIEKMRDRIIDFWRWIYENKFKDKKDLTEDDKKILSNLTRLTVYLREVNKENKEWLLKSAPYVYINFNISFLIEHLDRIKQRDEEGGRNIGKICLEMLKNIPSTYPLPEEKVDSIVEFLYQKGNKNIADEICNIYGARVNEFLRKIYNRYNSIS